MGIHLWAFVGISAVVIIAPGPDTVVVTKNAVLHGRRAALATSFGVNTGLAIWTAAAAFGVAAIIRESAVAFTVLKLVGAAYLAWLGIQALLAARRRTAHAGLDGDDNGSRLRTFGAYRQGVLSDLANPKIGIFFTGLLPQFVSGRNSDLVPFLILGAIFVLMTVVWLIAYSLVAARIADVLTRPSVKATLDRVSGTVLVGFGVRLALERR
jgi:RhtB (resistance to homoserine/threonine) family protein